MGHYMADAAEDLEPVEDLEMEVDASQETDEPADPPQGEDDGLDVSFDGEGNAPPRGEDSGLVRDLRTQLRERDRELASLRRQAQPQTIEVGEEPTLEACDYDTDKFKAEWVAWNERKAKAQEADAQAERQQEAQRQAWQQRLSKLESQKAELGAKDYESAADEVSGIFSAQQQSLIVGASENPARMIYALGKNPAKAAELAKIEDPVEFIAKVARLEMKVNVSPRGKPPEPERIVRGSAPLAKATDKHLERLEAEADRTGDRSKVIAYKRELRDKAKS